MDLSIGNPWWESGGLWQDVDLQRVKSSPLTYRPMPFSPSEALQDAVLTLRGPRRSGKTVTLKLFIAELIENHGWNAKEIVWTTFETFRTLEQIENHLLDIEKRFKPKLLIVDEVTSVIGWQRVIKKLRDFGVLANQCIILTGSSAYDLKAGAERMAGRRGRIENPDRVLLPMGFADFIQQVGPNHSIDLILSHYLVCGGFPFRVEELLRQMHGGRGFENLSFNPLSQFQVFDDVVMYEIIRRKLDRTIAIEILGRLSQIETSAVSYEAFAKPLSIARETARKYINALGDAFLLATIYSFDTSRGRIAPKKDKKLIWIDPALGYLGQWYEQGKAANLASRAEWAVGAALLRKFEKRIWEGLSAPRNVFTWKSSGGNEVDFLVVNKGEKYTLPVEVKYQNQISDWDFQVMERAFGQGKLITVNDARTRPKTESQPLDQFLRQM